MNENLQRFDVEAYELEDDSTVTIIHDFLGKTYVFDSSKPYSLWKWWHRPAWMIFSRRMKNVRTASK